MTESAAAAALDRAVRGMGWRSQRARLHHVPGHCLVLALHTPGPAFCPPEGTMCASVVHGGVLAQAGVTGRVPGLISSSLATVRGVLVQSPVQCVQPLHVCSLLTGLGMSGGGWG